MQGLPTAKLAIGQVADDKPGIIICMLTKPLQWSKLGSSSCGFVVSVSASSLQFIYLNSLGAAILRLNLMRIGLAIQRKAYVSTAFCADSLFDWLSEWEGVRPENATATYHALYLYLAF